MNVNRQLYFYPLICLIISLLIWRVCPSDLEPDASSSCATDEQQVVTGSIQLSSSCCNLSDDWMALLHCTNASIYHLPSTSAPSDERLSFAIIMFATKSVWEYASYAIAINTYYAQMHGYAIRFFHHNRYEPADDRWVKVKIVLEAMDTWASTYDYVAWIDADAIFLNLDFDLEAFVKSHSDRYHMLVSADGGSISHANTGMMLLRVSNVSRTLLHEWWNNVDRKQNRYGIRGNKKYNILLYNKA